MAHRVNRAISARNRALPVASGRARRTQSRQYFRAFSVHYMKLCIEIYMLNSENIYVYIIPGKKVASWQLVAVVMGLKTMQSGKKRRKIAKINPKSKEKIAQYRQGYFLGCRRF